MLSPNDAKRRLVELYTDEDSQVTIDSYPTKWSTGNGLMHSGLAITMLADLGINTILDERRFNIAVQKCTLQPGLYCKNEGREDQISHDDYTGIVSGSEACNLTFSKDIVNFGSRHFGLFNNNKKLEISDFFARFIEHYAFWLVAAETILGKLLIAPLLVYLLSTTPKSYTILHRYMMLSTIARKFPKLGKVCKNKINKIGLVEECGRYFGANHPIYDLAQNIVKL